VSVTAVDESPDMLAVAARRAARIGPRVGLYQMDAEHLALANNHFDTVVASLVLCSVVDVGRTLREIGRVLHKPGGRLLLLEHMRPHDRPLAWLADLANIPWYAFNGRCHLNRRTQQAVVEAGFVLDRVETRAGGFFRLLVAHIT
jgi:ubiquinone/menaquinone biosynthesis C-methylase UbiE